MADVASERLQLATRQAHLRSKHFARSGCGDIDDPAERVRSIESGTRTPHHFEPAHVLEWLRQAVPLLRTKERDRQVPPILEHQNPAVQGGVEAASIDVEIVTAVLASTGPGHA